MPVAREFDLTDDLDRVVSEHLADEGLVLFSHVSNGGSQAHFVAVLAGEDGPEIACAAAWRPRPGETMVRERLRIAVESACRKHLPASAGEALAAHLPDDVALRNAAGSGVRALLRDSDGSQTFYLVRVPGRCRKGNRGGERREGQGRIMVGQPALVVPGG